MPQMAPISWLTLFLVFSFTFILFNILNYFCFNNKTNTNPLISNKMDKNNFNKNFSMNWKW